MVERLKDSEKTPSVSQMVILSEIVDEGRIVIWRKHDGTVDFYNYGVMDPPLNKKTVESLVANEWVGFQKNNKGPDGYLITEKGTDVFENNKERVTKILGGEPPWRRD